MSIGRIAETQRFPCADPVDTEKPCDTPVLREAAWLSFKCGGVSPSDAPGKGIAGHPGAGAGMTLTNADHDHQHMFFRNGTSRTH